MRDLNSLRRAISIAAGVSLLPLPAAAHGDGDAHHWWSLDPWVWLPLLAFALLYARGMQLLRTHAYGRNLRPLRTPALGAFVTGMAALFLALIWPLDALSANSFAAHMGQHMVLIAIAAPLLVYAEPSVPILHALPALRRLTRSKLLKYISRIALSPRMAFTLHGVIIWLWHAPLPFELALRYEGVHVLEHVSFLGSGMLFWTALRQAGRAGGSGYGAAALWTLGTLMHTGLLGALITFSPRLLYASYAGIDSAWLTPMEDQQLAGLIMWIPAGMFYLMAGLGFAAAWLKDAERHPPRVKWRQ